jgi:plastocyanin
MKRPLTLFATPLTVLAVAACGSSHHKTQATTKIAAAAPPPTQTTPPTPTTQTTPPTTTKAAAPPAAPAAAHTVDVAANPSGLLKYTQSRVTTTAGKVTIDFTNKSPIAHDVVLIDSPTYSATAKVLGQTPIFQGGSKTFTVTLAAGTYYFYCSVPGHRQAGMVGTVSVTGASGAAAPAPSKPAKTKTASKPAPAPAAAHTVDLAANPSGLLKFTPSQITTTPGKVTIDFTNKSPVAHDVVLLGSTSYSATAKILGQTPQFQGGSKSFTVTLRPGKYYFYCSVPGHREAGMYGTLTVS